MDILFAIDQEDSVLSRKADASTSRGDEKIAFSPQFLALKYVGAIIADLVRIRSFAKADNLFEGNHDASRGTILDGACEKVHALNLLKPLPRLIGTPRIDCDPRLVQQEFEVDASIAAS